MNLKWLNELCIRCKQPQGVHSMEFLCPSTKTNGQVVPHIFHNEQKFEPSGEFKTD